MSNPKKISKTLILQDVLMHYRLPVFEKLANCHSSLLTVLTGAIGEGCQETQQFSIQQGRLRTLGGMTWIKGTQRQINDSGLVIIPFDVRHVGTLATAVRTRTPTILWGHSHGSRPFFNSLRRRMARVADSVLTYTEHGRQRLIADGIDAEKVFVANNTVHVQNAGLRLSVDRTALTFCGRITKRKRIDQLLSAFASLKNRVGNDVSVEIVGDGPELPSLKRLAADLHLTDRVVFHGALFEGPGLDDVFSRSLAYVSPGHVGLGVLHSFAFGVPPITARSAKHAPEFHHIVHDQNGLLFDGTQDDLENQIVTCCNAQKSLELGTQAAQHYAKNCTVDVAVDGFLNAVEHALQRSPR